MESPIRPYNPNGPGGPGGSHPPGARMGERTERTERTEGAAALPAGSALAEASLVMRVETRRTGRVAADVADLDVGSIDGAQGAEEVDAENAPPPPKRGGRRAQAERQAGAAPRTRAKAAAKAPAKTPAKADAAGRGVEDADAQASPRADARVGDAAAHAGNGASLSPTQDRELTARADVADLANEEVTHSRAGEVGQTVGVTDFEDIFTRFQTPLTNFVFRLVGNREQAYDLTQDVFVKAYRALSSGTTIQAAALSSWLYRIASNTATDALRRRRLISWLPLSLFNEDRGVGAGMPGMDLPNTQQGPSEEALNNSVSAFASGYDGGRFEQRVADREVVQRVLRRLPEKYAKCLLLYEYEGFSCAEIAEVLSVSPSAVKMRLMRARERFITLYREEVNG